MINKKQHIPLHFHILVELNQTPEDNGYFHLSAEQLWEDTHVRVDPTKTITHCYMRLIRKLRRYLNEQNDFKCVNTPSINKCANNIQF